MENRQAIQIVNRNAERRSFAEMVEREEARRRQMRARAARLRMLEKAAYMASGGILVVTMAGVMVMGLPGLAAVAGTVAAAGLFIMGGQLGNEREKL